jgi:hypothetical protein
MTSILLIGLAIALALYLLLAKTCLNSRGEPKKARKQEKAEIMRQLLALSDRENNISPAAPPLRSANPRTSKRSQPDKRSASRRMSSPVAPASRRLS